MLCVVARLEWVALCHCMCCACPHPGCLVLEKTTHPISLSDPSPSPSHIQPNPLPCVSNASFGIHVARIARMPPEVVEAASVAEAALTAERAKRQRVV